MTGMLADREELLVQHVLDRDEEGWVESDARWRLVGEDRLEVAPGSADKFGRRAMVLVSVVWGGPDQEIGTFDDPRQLLEGASIGIDVSSSEHDQTALVVRHRPGLLTCPLCGIAASRTVRQDDDRDLVTGSGGTDEESAAADLDVVGVRGDSDDPHFASSING